MYRFVGYADDHTKDVYRFLNIHMRRIILSRDVRWLNIIWKQYKKKSLYARRQVELFYIGYSPPLTNLAAQTEFSQPQKDCSGLSKDAHGL